MNEEGRLDLSPLDPTRDPARWEAVMGETMMRVDAVLFQRSRDPLGLIASWARPLLAAAAVFVALLVPAEVALEAREARSEQVRRLVALSAGWEQGGGPPSGSDFLRALAAEERP